MQALGIRAIYRKPVFLVLEMKYYCLAVLVEEHKGNRSHLSEGKTKTSEEVEKVSCSK